MRPQIENIFELLKDGKWHTIQEISEKTNLHEFRVEIMTQFLADYSFIRFKKGEKRAKLTTIFADFLKKL